MLVLFLPLNLLVSASCVLFVSSSTRLRLLSTVVYLNVLRMNGGAVADSWCRGAGRVDVDAGCAKRGTWLLAAVLCCLLKQLLGQRVPCFLLVL